MFPAVPHDLGVCVLRPLDEADAAWAGPELAALQPWQTLDYSAAALTAYLMRDDPALARFTLWADGERAGVAALRHPWLRGPYLELVAVTVPGRGLGSAVVAWAAARAGANLWTCVSAFNDAGRRFYRRQGFQEVAMLPDLVRPGFNEVLLRLVPSAEFRACSETTSG